MVFDEVDRRIVKALQGDGTLSQGALAEIVGASAASCWRRVKALENAGILGPTVRLVEPAAVGLHVIALCHLRLVNHHPKTAIDFEAFLETREEIVECYAISGDWDYFLRIVAKDIVSYEKILRKSLLANPTVATVSSSFALSVQKYSTALPIHEM